MSGHRICFRAVTALLCGMAGGALTARAAETELRLSQPLEHEVFQRRTADRGFLAIAGQWSVPRGVATLPEALEARVTPAREAEAGAAWAALPFDPRARGFRAELPLAPGGWYRVEVRLRRGDDILASAEVAQAGIGEVFVIAGQSNSANYGEERQRPQSGLVTAFDGERWRAADDPQPGAGGTRGSFIPSFGDALARELGVPIGVVCIGVGSTSVREWLPAGHAMSAPPTTGAHCVALAGGRLVSSGELFEKLAARLKVFPAGGVRAVLWHQGESDWEQPEGRGLPLEEFRADLAELIAASRTAAGWPVPWLVAQASYHSPASAGSAEFRAAQLGVCDGRLTLPGPNTDALGAAWRENGGRGVHFSGAGQKRHGELWAEVVGRWIHGGSSPETSRF
jgi:hypothetical protein